MKKQVLVSVDRGETRVALLEKKNDAKDFPAGDASAEAAPVPGPAPISAEEALVPFSVIIDGQNRTVMARDFDDAQARAARLRSA